MKHYFSIFLLTLILGVTAVSSCKKDGPVSDIIPVTQVVIDQNALTLVMGQKVSLTAKVFPENASDKTVIWSSSDNDIVLISKEGIAVALGEGAATITVQSGDVSDQITVTVTNPEDLSFPLTANCYIVSKPGGYKFKAVKGNSNESVGDIAIVEVMWESFGTETAPAVGDIVSSVSYWDNYILFSTPSTLKNGNALIAARDSRAHIIWSWHIWTCEDYAPDEKAQMYFNGQKMMDRNLGATSAIPGEAGALGLVYQWGRKDPFMGASSISAGTKAVTYRDPWNPAHNTEEGVSMTYTIENPMTFIIRDTEENKDWCSDTDNERWQANKTKYDPCPPGWKVPAGDISGVWASSVGSEEQFDWPFDETKYGMNFANGFGSGDIWYPAAGYMRGDTDYQLRSVGSFGRYWSCTRNSRNAFCLFFSKDGSQYVCPADESPNLYYAFPIRCIQER